MLPLFDLALLFSVVQILLAAGVTAHAVLNKRDSRAAIGWTALAWLVPYVGPLAYFVLGINRIYRAGTRLGLSETLRDNPQFEASEEEMVQAQEALKNFPNFAGLVKAGEVLTSKPLLPGNSIHCLIDGDEAYPEMIEAINKAEKTIGLLSYIFDADRAGDQFVEALVRAKDRGVAVRVLVDDVGARYSKENIVERLSASGVTAASFLPTRGWRSRRFSNLRNHRKILVIDGRVGFTGGTNIREAHCLRWEPKSPTQCLHFKVEGPVIAQISEVFVTDWKFATGEKLLGPAWFPCAERAGSVWARGVSHGPDEDFETLSKLIFAALSSARDRVRILSPYFLPDARLTEALAVAALRGVTVEIYLPSDNNIKIVEWASMAQLDLIMEHGCRVYITRPPFDHTKLTLVDETWALVGSTNLDPRSLRLNFEFNVECYNPYLSEELQAIVDKKAMGAKELTLDDLNSRPFPKKLRDGLARLLSPYL